MVYNNCIENVNLPYKIEGLFILDLNSNMVLKIKVNKENNKYTISVYNNDEEIGKNIGQISSDKESILRWNRAFYFQQSFLFLLLLLIFIIIAIALLKQNILAIILLGLGYLIISVITFLKINNKFKKIKKDIYKYIN